MIYKTTVINYGNQNPSWVNNLITDEDGVDKIKLEYDITTFIVHHGSNLIIDYVIYYAFNNPRLHTAFMLKYS